MRRLMVREAHRRGVVEAAVAGVSCANIALIPTWLGLFDPERTIALGGEVSFEAYAAAFAVLAISAVVAGVAASLRYRLEMRFEGKAFCDALVIGGAAAVSFQLWHLSGGDLTRIHLTRAAVRSGGWVVLVAVAVGLLSLTTLGWRTWMNLAKKAFLVVSPFAVYTSSRAGLVLHSTDWDNLNASVKVKALAAPRSGARVVVLVFDELDYTYAFSKRPLGVLMPEFDQLRKESMFSTDVSAPANATAFSMPSYLVGKKVDSVSWRSVQSEGVVFRGDSAISDLATQSTIFDDAASHGARAELIGVFLPYCRWAFAAKLAGCFSRPMTWGGVFDGEVGLFSATIRQFMALAAVGNRREHAERIRELSERALHAVSDPSIRLVFVHLPIPHLPPVWNAKSKQFTYTRVRASAYFENLELADAILGRLKQAIVNSPVARETFLVVTSDHPWRSGPLNGMEGGRIPFIVRSPTPVASSYSGHLEAVVLRALSNEILAGRLQKAEDVSIWLSKH